MENELETIEKNLQYLKDISDSEQRDIDILSSDLNEFEKQFCLEYVTNGYNATRAAITCGWKESTANSKAYKLVGKVGIANEIKRLQGLRFKKIFESDVMSKTEILKFWSDVARGTLVNPNALPQKQFDRQLSFLDNNEGETDFENLKIPVSQRLKASELLAKNMEMLAPDSVNNIYNNYSDCTDEDLKNMAEALMNGKP